MSEPVDTAAAPEEPATAVAELPGRTLRGAREAKALTVADIAQALKFSARQIEALEADDYAILPGVTFIRGAVRSYAKFLKLDPTALLAMLDATAPPAPPDVRPPQNMGTAMSDRGGRQISPLIAASVLLLVIAVVIGVWHSLGGPQPFAVANVGGQASAVPAAETEQPVVPPQVKVEQPAVADIQPPTAQPQPPLADQGQSAPAAAAPTSAAPLPAGRQLLFVFGEKSWVEVKDASQQTIFTGQQPAGSRQSIYGRPPFQVVVGNAAKVELFDGERQVDLRPYTRAEVARLTIE